MVKTSAGLPIRNAQVTAASRSLRATHAVQTDSAGVFEILVQNGGGDYSIVVTAPRYAVANLALKGTPGTILTLPPVLLAIASNMLPPVSVRGRRIRPDMPGAGGIGAGEAFSRGTWLTHFLDDPRSLDNLGLLIPEAVATIDGYSVGGASPGENGRTLDGASVSLVRIPQDAVGAVVLTKGSSDVSRGGFSGGAVAVTTPSGSRIPRTFAKLSLSQPVAEGNNAFVKYARGGATFLGSVRNSPRLLYFGAIELENRVAGTPANFQSSSRLQSDAPQSALDSLSTAMSGFGLNRIPTGRSPVAQTLSGLVNLQRVVDEGWSGAGRVTGSASSDVSIFGDVFKRAAGGLFGSYYRNIGARFLTSGRSYLEIGTENNTPREIVPSFVVGIPVAAAGQSSLTPVGFGGSGLTAFRTARSSWEVANDMEWEREGSRHRFKAGVFARLADAERRTERQPGGRFGFRDIQSFADNRPSSFSRRLEPASNDASTLASAFYFSDRLTISPRSIWTFGLRLEQDRLTGAPMANPNDPRVIVHNRTVRTLALLPRVGATLRFGSGYAGQPRGEIRATAGDYRSRYDQEAADFVLNRGGESETILCGSGATPAPDWLGYAQGAAHPTDCLPSSSGVQTGAVPSFSTLPRDFTTPRTRKVLLESLLSTSAQSTLSLQGTITRGFSQATSIDLNRVRAPRFLLPDEQSRPVFVDPTAIDPLFGIPNWLDSRFIADTGAILERRSDARLRGLQLGATLALNSGALLGGVGRLTYTWSRIEDQARAFATGLGQDPRQLTWAKSGNERRHQFFLTAGFPKARVLRSFFTLRFASGAPYTPLIAGDIDGDGSAFDPAFLFDATQVGGELAQQLTRLAQSGVGGQDCLATGIGRIARRNSCVGRWSFRADARAYLNPQLLGGGDRASVSLRVSNLTAGLDELFHRGASVRGWGQPYLPDAVLLVPDGFDSTTRRYSYRANPRFGQATSDIRRITDPFRVSIDVRILVGPDPRRAQISRMLGGNWRMSSDSTIELLKKNVMAGIPNPMRRILPLRDTLGLSKEQVDRISAIDLAYTADVDDVWTAISSRLAPDARLDVARASRLVNDASRTIQEIQLKWGQELKRLLSSVQQSMVPLYVKFVMNGSTDDIEQPVPAPIGP